MATKGRQRGARKGQVAGAAIVALSLAGAAQAEGLWGKIFGGPAELGAPLATSAGDVSAPQPSTANPTAHPTAKPSFTDKAPPALAEQMRGTTGSQAHLPVPQGETPVAAQVETGTVEMGVIGAAPTGLSVGLLPAARAGLPEALWGASREADLIALIARPREGMMPALQDLFERLLIAELALPKGLPAQAGTATGEALFLARIDQLMALGALDPAMMMLELSGFDSPARFARYFDLALLTGEEERACAALTEANAPSPNAQIFCLARAADWARAEALYLSTEPNLSAEDKALFGAFMDDAMVDEGTSLTPPSPMTPLAFRMLEAVGQAQPTTYLPLAYAATDLRANSGWKARLEAAERLARAGTVDANRMLGLYTEESPAASGGVWERARAMAELDAALSRKPLAPSEIGAPLEAALRAMAEAELESILADLYGETLSGLALAESGAALPEPARNTALRVALTGPTPESVAEKLLQSKSLDTKALDGDLRFWLGLARGRTLGVFAQDTLGAALKPVFETAQPPLPERYSAYLSADRRGEAMLLAMEDITEGARGDYRRVTEGLIALRSLGLEHEARATALQLMLLERRG